ncbi:2OG-Fe(II) oxygenase [Alphaproteobacteria bacterium]|nr:2OG-Fe(II) oxygenase [Alphaproteobacteria bacterium]
MFVDIEEKKLSDEFLKNGYIIRDIKEIDSLDFIRSYLFETSKKILKKNFNINTFFNNFHTLIDISDLNDIRVKIIQEINNNSEMRRHYYFLSKYFLDYLVGNEVSMQMRLNLSIQLPNDDSSLLQIHADTWSGDSPFETVAWLPLVDCYNTKSMFLLPPDESKIFFKNFSSSIVNSSEDLFHQIKDKIKWLEIKYGQILLFNQGLPHGNRINMEKETRWSMNCRFKGAFTPYYDKKIGEFFEPINLKAASIAGMQYRDPE